ncbi:hypothetical protein SAMN04487894_111151 [Niabella drilacis]|uniref:YD repeat-containing protein n=2 Tax=Niabella drilacis (strain DSM 25811 / CCM 8410 / CCUG 62505 / LMG 26954 / E90) TaxID=1285928 RepID=A0A1G6WIU5_NIADE|nr:hypothetical protein SAMN04487894_111151 [Niabella drilacis]
MTKKLCSILFLCLFFASCKKDGGNAASKADRIAGIKSSVFHHIYQYDGQNRLTGIDYGISSKMKAEYSPSGIVLQWYDGANNPTAYRIEMNVVDGRVTDAIETNDNFSIQHDYNYDSEGRMQQAQATKRNAQNNQTVNKGESKFTWNGSLLSKVVLQVWDANGAKTDSIIWDISYYENKKYFTWEDMGFSFFGKAPIGGFPNGFGFRLPLLFLSEGMIPSAAAMKSGTRKSYYRHNGQWQLTNGNSEYPETLYGYDAQGRLNKWGDIEINWK